MSAHRIEEHRAIGRQQAQVGGELELEVYQLADDVERVRRLELGEMMPQRLAVLTGAEATHIRNPRGPQPSPSRARAGDRRGLTDAGRVAEDRKVMDGPAAQLSTISIVRRYYGVWLAYSL